jgi:GR25 family glycosyltransferase involved in LPS biosynthesis
MRILWINLDSSCERRSFMEEELKYMNYENHRFSAITPDRLQEILYNLKKKISNSEFACLSSHLSVIRKCLDFDDEWFCIMEDDMKLNCDINFNDLIKSAPEDAEILQLFTSNEGEIIKLSDVYDRTKSRWIKWKRNMWSAGVYLIKRNAIIKILKSVYDNEIIDLREIKTAYVADEVIYGLCETYTSTYPCAKSIIDLGSVIHPKHLKMHERAVIEIEKKTKHLTYKEWFDNGK